MAKNKRRRHLPSTRVEVSLETLSDGMRAHVLALGLKSVDAYLQWCRQNGFVQRLTKSNSELRRENLQAVRAEADAVALRSDRVRNPVHLVRSLLAGKRDGIPDSYRGVAAALCRSSRSKVEGRGRRDLLAVLLGRMAEVAPRLLEPDSEGATIAVRIAEHWQHATESPDDWRPTSHNARRSLTSLIRHVFAKYPVPLCLERAWFDDDDTASGYRRLYLHVAHGNNLRTAALPITYTKKMAHCFAEAPGDFTVTEALRFGQVRGLGGDAQLAGAVVATRLGRGFEHDEFWRTVIQFLARYGIRDIGEVTAIVDYVHEHRFGAQLFLDERGRQHELPPPQPALSMARRTPETLRRQVEAWHARLGRGGRGAKLRWASSGIPGYREVEQSAGKRRDRSGDAARRVWLIRELCSGEELRLESHVMNHCVFSYSSQCARGATRIFSMRFEERGELQTVLTIEVRGTAIVQARGRRNAAPSSKARAILERWAKGAGLQIRSYV